MHSFSTLGGTANSIILYALLGVVVFSLGLLVWRGGQIKNDSEATENATSRDFGMTMAVVLLLVCAVITGAGMSAPLITEAGAALHITKVSLGSVPASFYNKANFPVAVLLMIGMAIGPYLSWRQTTTKAVEPLMWLYLIAVAFAIGFVVYSRQVLHANATVPLIVLFTSCILCVIANAALLLKRRSNEASGNAGVSAGIRTAGGALAHIGAALLLLGVVFLVAWYRQSDQIIVQGQPRPVDSFPMTLGMAGQTSNINDPANKLRLSIAEGPEGGAQSHYLVYMPLALRSVQGQMQMVARPVIAHRWWGDVYIAWKDGPEDLSPVLPLKSTFSEGQSLTFKGYKIEVGNFSADPVAAAMARSGQMPDKFPVTIPLMVTAPGGKPVEVDPQYIQYGNNPLGETSPEIRLPLGPDKLPWAIAITNIRLMKGQAGTADFYVRDSGVPMVTAYVLNVSTRPMINLVWVGTVLIALGGLLSMRRRIVENRLVPIPDFDESAPSESPELSRNPNRTRLRNSRRSPVPAKGGN